MKYLPARFWAKVDARDDGCWPWIGSTNRGGYAVFWWDGKMRLAHRLIVGDPPGVQIAHSCALKSCVNPDHLRFKTTVGGEKMAHRYVKPKLTQALADEIRERHTQGGILQKELAAEYGVSPVTVCLILKGKAWIG